MSERGDGFQQAKNPDSGPLQFLQIVAKPRRKVDPTPEPKLTRVAFSRLAAHGVLHPA